MSGHQLPPSCRRQIIDARNLVRNSQFARDNRTSARQQPSSSHVPNRREDPDEHDALYPVAETRRRQNLPEEPQDRLSARNRPNGTIKVPPLVSFSLGRRFDARQESQRPETPHRACDWKVSEFV